MKHFEEADIQLINEFSSLRTKCDIEFTIEEFEIILYFLENELNEFKASFTLKEQLISQ